MGLPELSIAFKEQIRKPIKDVGIGKILMILKDQTVQGKKEYYNFKDVVDDFSTENKEFIEHALIGNVQDVRVAGALETKSYTPEKLTVFAFSSSSTLDKALAELENEEFDYLVMPEATDGDNTKLKSYLDRKKEQNLEAFLIIATSKESNSSDVIEVKVGNFRDSEKDYTDGKLLPYIAGICAGTPIEQSITYASIEDIKAVPSKTKSEINSLIDGGKLTLFNKAGKVRIASGVTSLKAPEGDQGETFKKIKPVRIYKYINNVITNLIQQYYIGKVPNSYTNKLVLISEIKQFLKDMAKSELIEEKYSVEINIAKNTEYLTDKGKDVKSMTIDEIREANTGNKVYLTLTIRAIDSMEDFDIIVEV